MWLRWAGRHKTCCVWRRGRPATGGHQVNTDHVTASPGALGTCSSRGNTGHAAGGQYSEGGEAGPRIARLILCRAQTPVRATCKGGNRKGPDTYLCAFGSRATLNARALAEGLRSRNTYGSTSMELFRPHCKVRIIPGRRWKSMPSLEQVRWAALRPPGMLIPL